MTFFNNLRYIKFLLLALMLANAVLWVLFIDNYYHTLKLQKKLDQINKELYLKEIIQKKQLKEYEKKAKQRQKKLERMRSEIKNSI
ncbi:hypothetical protein D0817_24485 [Flavobacterium cupreum]|uniref:Uncharacterized protein n=2 Tax=Flavobacterium TaxID=237 RepID=A0A940X9U3_9FLAO|nr:MULTISPECIES: hypothetical protein [Flavobacterium]MBP4139141.1 hypothetical protein [Flavobacterium geliluteum]RUT67814.1 hypothetical protein D0817_24485 [Flavobacterium cupreum]